MLQMWHVGFNCECYCYDSMLGCFIKCDDCYGQLTLIVFVLIRAMSLIVCGRFEINALNENSSVSDLFMSVNFKLRYVGTIIVARVLL